VVQLTFWISVIKKKS